MSDTGREVQYTESDVVGVFESRDDYAEPLTSSSTPDVSVSRLLTNTTRDEFVGG